ncbi:MAG: hypothetical protein ACRCYX_03220 [Dermatophilaceae bacterium]
MTVAALSAQVRSEADKTFSLRSTWACLAVAVLAVDGLGLLQVSNQPAATAGDLAAGAGLAMLVILAFGAVMGTSDVQFGTLRTARLAQPSRVVGYVGKVVTVAAIGGLAGLVAGAVLLGVAAAGGVVLDADLLRATVGQGVVFFLGAGTACAAGLLLRRTGLAVALVIIWVQVVEPLSSLVPEIGPAVRPWLPFLTSIMFTNPVQFAEPPHSPGFALAYFGAVTTVFVVAAGVRVVRADG